MKKILKIALLTILLQGCNNTIFYNYQTNSTNVLYLNVQNRIRIENENKNKLIVSIDNGKIVKVDSNTYVITVDSGMYSNLSIVQGHKNANIKFRNKQIPTPAIGVFGDSLHDIINETTAEKFKTFKVLIPVLIDFDYACSARVTSYTMTRITSSGKSETCRWNDTNYDYIPNIVTDIAKKAESGDIYLFYNIIVKFKEMNEPMNVNNFFVRIK